MKSRGGPKYDSSSAPGSTRRGLLRALTATPVALAVSPGGEALASLHEQYDDKAAIIARTREGRALSLWRYHTAEGFFPYPELDQFMGWNDFLYRAGISAQLALSSHLLDIGFADEWCARHIGLRIAKSLAYANATGFGHNCPEMARLADVLTPYSKWRDIRLYGEPKPNDDGFTEDQVRALLCVLLDRVHDLTGHPRPDRFIHNGRRVEA